MLALTHILSHLAHALDNSAVQALLSLLAYLWTGGS